jgi:spermidine synthase
MRRRSAIRLSVLLFFLSGVGGLVLEVIWLRLLRELFGVTAHAVSVVLAAYLGGLALGAWKMGRRADRTADPLRLYGLLEVGVGLSSLLGLAVVKLAEPIHLLAASRLAPDSLLLLGLRLLIALAVVLPPTFLMGGTLPALSRLRVRELASAGRELSWLYMVNSAGAVVGTLAAGFYLVGAMGVHRTFGAVVVLDLAVGVAALVLARQARPAEPAPAAAVVAPDPGATDLGLLVAIGLSGFVSLALEVVWTRVLILVVGTSTYAFSTMLCVFLTGITLGGLLCSRFVDRVAQPRRLFGWLQVGIAAATLATVPLLGALVSSGQLWLAGLEHHWLAAVLGRFVLAFAVLIVPTTLIGISFPLAVRIGARSLDGVGTEVGRVQGANILGNVAGSLVGGFLLIPVAGLQRGVLLLALLNLAAAGWALFPTREARRQRRAWLRAAPVALGLAAFALLVAQYQPQPFGSLEESGDDQLLFYQEGLVSTVKVVRRASDGRQLVMLVDGVRIGQSSAGIDFKQQVLAHLPFLLLEQPVKQVLSIGLGTGVLSGEVAAKPGVERVESVELSDSVVAGAHFFGVWNHDLWHNPTSRVIVDDGVAYLRRSGEKYDAIISDGKSRLGHVGNAAFFSEEFYRDARDHLAPGGVMLQWMPLEEVPDELRIMLRTFFSVFAHGYLWVAQDSCFLVGTDHPLRLDLARMQQVLDAPESASLRRHGWDEATEVVGHLVADRDSAREWLQGESILNTLDRPVLEYHSLGGLATEAPAREAANLSALAPLRAAALQSLGEAGADPRVRASSAALGRLLEGLQLAARRAGAGDRGPEVRAFQEAAEASPEGGALRHWVAELLIRDGLEAEREGRGPEALALFRGAVESFPDSLPARVNLASELAAAGSQLEAAAQLQAVLQRNPESGDAHELLAELMQDAGNLSGAVEHLEQAVRIGPSRAALRVQLGRALATSGRARDALAQYREAMRLQPELADAWAGAALVAGDATEAVRLARRAVALSPGEWSMHSICAAALNSAGLFDEAVESQLRAVDLLGSRDPALAAREQASLERYQRNARAR